LYNKRKFVSLKRLLSILSFVLFMTVVASAQDAPGKSLKLYPNPATSYITFDLQKDHQRGLTLAVFNFMGKKMYEAQNVNEKTTVTLTDFNRGMYIYHLLDPTGKIIVTGKFQVSK
jgi:Secretion system C-terminal sorting domain